MLDRRSFGSKGGIQLHRSCTIVDRVSGGVLSTYRTATDTLTRSRAGRIVQAVTADTADPGHAAGWSYTYDQAAHLAQATLAATTRWAWANHEREPGSTAYGSRWSAGKSLASTPVRPERVVEVRYDYMEGARFRHTAQFVRWRPDRVPRSCTFEQVERPATGDLSDVLGLR